MALILSGDTGPSFVQSAAMPTGAVIQTVSAVYASQILSSSSTFADTNLTATITPTSATSKILVLVNHNGLGKETANTYLAIQLLRNGTVLEYIESLAGYNTTTTQVWVGGCSTSFLDSPASTSALTYKTQFRNNQNSGNVYINGTGSYTPTSTMVLMEIKF